MSYVRCMELVLLVFRPRQSAASFITDAINILPKMGLDMFTELHILQ